MRLRFRPHFSIATLFVTTAIAATATNVWFGPRKFTVTIPPPPCFADPPQTATYWAVRGGNGTWIKHGLETIRDHYGNLELTEYKNGKRNGSFRKIRNDGKVLIKGQFVNDQRDGTWWNVCYLPGQSHEISQYETGRQIEQVVYFTNGETKRYVSAGPPEKQTNENQFESPFDHVPDDRLEVESNSANKNSFEANPFASPVGAE
jgi:hypothetical protein